MGGGGGRVTGGGCGGGDGLVITTKKIKKKIKKNIYIYTYIYMEKKRSPVQPTQVPTMIIDVQLVNTKSQHWTTMAVSVI